MIYVFLFDENPRSCPLFLRESKRPSLRGFLDRRRDRTRDARPPARPLSVTQRSSRIDQLLHRLLMMKCQRSCIYDLPGLACLAAAIAPPLEGRRSAPRTAERRPRTSKAARLRRNELTLAPHGRRLRLLNASLLLGADEGPSRAIPCRRRRWSDATRDRGVGWHSPPLSSSSASSHQRISIPIPRLRGHLPRDRSEPFSKSQRPPRARLYFLFFFP